MHTGFFLGGGTSGKKTTWRLRHGWIFRKWDVGAWTGLIWFINDGWRELVNAVINCWVPLNGGKFLTS